jgi:hypothetical protein
LESCFGAAGFGAGLTADFGTSFATGFSTGFSTGFYTVFATGFVAGGGGANFFCIAARAAFSFSFYSFLAFSFS